MSLTNQREELRAHTNMATLVRNQNTRTWPRFKIALRANRPTTRRATNTWMASLNTVPKYGLSANHGAAVTITARHTVRTIHPFMSGVRFCRALNRAVVGSPCMQFFPVPEKGSMQARKPALAKLFYPKSALTMAKPAALARECPD